MVVVSRSIHVDVPVGRAFAFMSDPAERSRLAPDVTPIRAEIEGSGPLRLGARCYFRLQSAGRILEYHTRVTEFEPDRRFVTLSDSAIPFETRIETRPEDGGTRLSQTERFEPSDELLRQVLADHTDQQIMDFAKRLFLFTDAEGALRLRRRQEEMLAHRLEAKLERWLAAIKLELEKTAVSD